MREWYEHRRRMENKTEDLSLFSPDRNRRAEENLGNDNYMRSQEILVEEKGWRMFFFGGLLGCGFGYVVLVGRWGFL